MRDMNIIICGVGGQGIVFLTRMIGETMIRMGKKVVSSEAHGLSRMLGSISSMMRVGDYSSGGFERADVIIAMEPLEALRHVHLLSDGGVVISSDDEVRIKDYPADIAEKLKPFNATIISTKELCKGIDDVPRDNVVLYGAFCRKFDIPEQVAEAVIKDFKDKDKNLSAFRLGFDHGR